jgi:twitching motility protein PilT
VLREDPDVILVGEMRDLETIAAALTLAETGHLVFATLHTRSAAATMDRIVDVFPAHQQQQIRIQLSASIEAVVSQQLLPRLGGGRVAAIEILVATSAIRNLIREGKTHQIMSVIETSQQNGMQAMDRVLADLHRHNIVSYEEAISHSLDRENFLHLLKGY